MKLKIFASLLFTVILAASCASGPVYISEDLIPMELIQRAQEASDRNRYSVSLQFYNAVLERFPNDIDSICAAEYEIAFIHYKQKNYQAAREGLTALLEYYNSPDAELLPQQFKRLAQIVLERISEIENNPRSRQAKRR